MHASKSLIEEFKTILLGFIVDTTSLFYKLALNSLWLLLTCCFGISCPLPDHSFSSRLLSSRFCPALHELHHTIRPNVARTFGAIFRILLRNDGLCRFNLDVLLVDGLLDAHVIEDDILFVDHRCRHDLSLVNKSWLTRF